MRATQHHTSLAFAPLSAAVSSARRWCWRCGVMIRSPNAPSLRSGGACARAVRARPLHPRSFSKRALLLYLRGRRLSSRILPSPRAPLCPHAPFCPRAPLCSRPPSAPPRCGLAAGAVPSRRTRCRSARCASTTRTRAASPRRVQQQRHVNRLYSAHHESFVVRVGVPKVPRGSGRRWCAQSSPQQQQALVTKTLAIIRRLLRPPLPFARASRSTAVVASSSSATASRTRARRATCTPALSGATDC